jgi:hypothetical protein
MIDTDRLRESQRTRTEGLCRHYFPLGKKNGGEWKIGDITGAPGDSLGIQLTGPKAGLWHDRATGQGGDFIELLRANRNLTFQEAVEEVERALGVSLRMDSLPGMRSAPAVSPIPSPVVPVIPAWTGLPYHMTPKESRRCYAAAKALGDSPGKIQSIAEWRFLKSETVWSLVLDCALGIEGSNNRLLVRERDEAAPNRREQSSKPVGVWQTVSLAWMVTNRSKRL